MLITIDGPAGVGKSTIARLLAQKLGFPFFETGALYRAITYKALSRNINLEQEEQFSEILEDFQIDSYVEENKRVFILDGTNVTAKLRSEEVTQNVALVSTYLSVRKKVETIQQELGSHADAIFEGRDMGSVVFPKADLKIFLTASAEIRAQRRFNEISSSISYENVLEDVKKRDHIDTTREHSPLICPKDAISINTDTLSIDEVLEKIYRLYMKIYKRRTRSTWIYMAGKTLFSILFKIFYRHRVIGIENIPTRGAVIAPNHASYLEPILVPASLPRFIHSFARESLFRNPIFGYLLKKVGTHPIQRSSGGSSALKQAIDLITKGCHVLIFPEGTRSKDGSIQKFKPGATFIAASSNGLIVPTYVKGSFDAWSINKKWPKLRGRTTVIFGKPIDFAAYAHLEHKEAIETCTRDLQKAVEALSQEPQLS